DELVVLWSDSLGMWEGEDEIFEFLTYPSFSWKTQALTVYALIALDLLPLRDRNRRIWNGMHVNFVSYLESQQKRRLNRSVQWPDFGHRLLFTSRSRVRHCAQDVQNSIIPNAYGRSILAMGVGDKRKEPWAPPKRIKTVRYEYRMASVGPL